MDYEIDFPALSMDSRQSPLHTMPPPAPPPNHPDPSSHPNPITSTNDTAQSVRPTLNPIPPSKRAALHSVNPVDTSEENSTDICPNYLPREIIDLIKTRQSQEKFWQTRLAICTSVVSNIDSTLSSFKDESGQKEAQAIRNLVDRVRTNSTGHKNRR